MLYVMHLNHWDCINSMTIHSKHQALSLQKSQKNRTIMNCFVSFIACENGIEITHLLFAIYSVLVQYSDSVIYDLFKKIQQLVIT